MVVYFSETLQVAVEGVALLTPQRLLVSGWMMTPRGVAPELRLLNAAGTALPPLLQLHPPRPEVPLPLPAAAQLQGFLLLVEDPAPQPFAAPLTLAIGAGAATGRINLGDANLNRDLSAMLAGQPPQLGFALLQACAQHAALLPLLTHDYREHGAFAGWLARLPQVRGRAEPAKRGLDPAAPPLLRAEAGMTAAGEFMLGLQFSGRPVRRLEVEVLALARLRSPDGGPELLRLVPLADSLFQAAATTGLFYGRIAPEGLPQLQGLELVAAIRFDEQPLWLRVQPRLDTVPAFLNGIAAQPGAALEPDQAEALLQGVLERRAAGLLPRLAALATAPREVALPGGLALLLGLDEPACVPLLEVLAGRIEARCDRLVLTGARAEQAAQIFRRRGRIPALAVADAQPILAEAAATGTAVVPLDPLRLGQAVIAQDLDALFAARLGGAELALLQALHGFAGSGAGLADSLARLLRARQAARTGARAAWQPPAQAWCRPLAAQLVNDHLERLWTLPA